jgi:hypothetical protein
MLAGACNTFPVFWVKKYFSWASEEDFSEAEEDLSDSEEDFSASEKLS